MISWVKENIIALLGITLPGSVSIYSIIEKATPIITFIALVASLGVGIIALVNGRKKGKLLDKELNKK